MNTHSLPQSRPTTSTRRSAYTEYRERLAHEATYEQQVRAAESRDKRTAKAIAETASFLGGIFSGDQIFA